MAESNIKLGINKSLSLLLKSQLRKPSIYRPILNSVIKIRSMLNFFLQEIDRSTRPLLPKSAVCRLLAEMVKSYAGCARYFLDFRF